MLGFRLRASGTGQRARRPDSLPHRPARDNRSQQPRGQSQVKRGPKKQGRSDLDSWPSTGLTLDPCLGNVQKSSVYFERRRAMGSFTFNHLLILLYIGVPAALVIALIIFLMKKIRK
jgi:hypothetical protein